MRYQECLTALATARVAAQNDGMTKKKRAKKRPDPAMMGFDIMQRVIAASGDTPDEPDLGGKDPAAVALGRKGGLKGGKARAQAMTKKQRSEAARKAARARWGR